MQFIFSSKRLRKKPQCLSAGVWLNKFSSILVAEFCAAIKRYDFPEVLSGLDKVRTVFEKTRS